MLLSIGDLTRFTATAQDASFPIKDIFFSLSDRSMAYLIIDTGQWFDTNTVLVSTSLIADILADDRTVTLDADEAKIRSAPRWQDDNSALTDALPPIVVGPFGNTISPAMMAAMIQQPEHAEGDIMTDSLDQFTKLDGMDVFGNDGELGRVIDLLLSPKTRAITHMVVDNGKVLAGRQLIVPIEKLRHQAAQNTHLVLDLTSSELADAPQMEYADRLDRNWIDALRNYYQLPI